MKLCTFGDDRLGGLSPDGTLQDITSVVGDTTPPVDRMNELIRRWDELAAPVHSLVMGGSNGLTSSSFGPPQPRPSKIIAAPANHRAHLTEMAIVLGLPEQDLRTIEDDIGFLKAPSSLVGPRDPIVIPASGRRIDYEGELGVVIGRECRGVSRENALNYVFGYLPLIDVTMRGGEDRSFRKSFDTFTPTGPMIVTADEIPDPGALTIQLSLNGDLRQSASASEFIFDIPTLIETYSASITLHPGDIIASGTPAGVGPLADGDEIRLQITGLPELVMRVVSAS